MARRPFTVLTFLFLQQGRVPSLAEETPLSPDSKWTRIEENGTVTGAMRDNDAIVLRGTGSGIAENGGKAVLTQGTGSGFGFVNETAITARLVSLDGAGGTGEAGVRMESRDDLFGKGIGMSMYYRPDGTLRWHAGIYTSQVPDAPPITGLSLPLWLRIQCINGSLQGFYSSDGIAWTAVCDDLPVTLPPVAFPALLVSSGGHAAPGTARFDHLWIAGGDADDNGIKDGWELTHFNRLLGADASADPDGDGAGNFDEWMWGTNPNLRDHRPSLLVERGPYESVSVSLVGYPAAGHEPLPYNHVRFETAPSPQGPWEPTLSFGGGKPLYYWQNMRWPVDAPRRFFRALVDAPLNDPWPRPE